MPSKTQLSRIGTRGQIEDGNPGADSPILPDRYMLIILRLIVMTMMLTDSV